MEGFGTRNYGTGGPDNRPLFGETSARDRVINLVVGGFTSLLLVVTLISAFVFPQLPPKPVNIFFAFCISLCCISAGILWENDGHWEHPAMMLLCQTASSSALSPTRHIQVRTISPRGKKWVVQG
ncbi:transmembrane protein 243 isoform X2 [Calypte anna]|uniref:transmembrane protein 243 isoform X2 n=1 Tax=Calypte anna TaxID=9244 RepID=UPI0011C469DE|nr:transmembrane protein 243 isoform X2 [Calypte anna]